MKEPTMEEVLELVSFKRDESGELHVCNVFGCLESVEGSIYGDVHGNVHGSVGYVYGSVGNVGGDVLGNVWGKVHGKVFNIHERLDK
jgi:hypothetical protein